MRWWETRKIADVRSVAGDAIVGESRKDGIFEITLSSWRLIDAVLYTMNDMSHAIYRGVSQSDHRLEPSIFRRYAFRRMQTIDARNDYILNCFRHFKEAVRGRRGPLAKPVEFYNDYELWSLGRHFGVKNTMLDWSHSPYVSLFFAFSNWSEEGTRALFCLKRNVIERFQNAGTRPDDIEKSQATRDGRDTDSDMMADLTLSPFPGRSQLAFYKPFSDDNFRMIHQQGLFTVSKSPHTVEEWVAHNYGEIRRHLLDARNVETEAKRVRRLSAEIESGWILLRINVRTDEADRRDILKKLNRMNVNYATLFPDIEGASMYANMQGDIPHY